VRSKHSRTKSFSVLSARKLEQERKLDEAGSGEAKEGMLARKPLNFENDHWFPQLSSLID